MNLIQRVLRLRTRAVAIAVFVVGIGAAMADEQGAAGFAELQDQLQEHCRNKDANGFSAIYGRALAVATDGKQDTEELRRLTEVLSGYFATNASAPGEDVYLAWLQSVRSTLAFDPTKQPSYPAEEASSVVQAQAGIAQLLLKLDGIAFLDAQKDKRKVWTSHLKIVGDFIDRVSQSIGDQKAAASVNPNALSDEAMKALADSGEVFIAGGDPSSITDEKARALVIRDYDRNRAAAASSMLRQSRSEVVSRLPKLAAMSVKRMVAQGHMTAKEAAQALASGSIPKATWLEAFER